MRKAAGQRCGQLQCAASTALVLELYIRRNFFIDGSWVYHFKLVQKLKCAWRKHWARPCWKEEASDVLQLCTRWKPNNWRWYDSILDWLWKENKLELKRVIMEKMAERWMLMHALPPLFQYHWKWQCNLECSSTILGPNRYCVSQI